MNKEIDWTKDEQFIPHHVTAMPVCEAVYVLRQAWNILYGEYPSDKSLAVLFGKSALETGRWNHMHNFNFGNIKKKHIPTDTNYFTMFRCFEVIKGETVWFDPPHIQTHFVAYKNALEGAIGYLRFVSSNPRYHNAWQRVIDGDPEGYAHELKAAGYYTADEAEYTKGVLKLYNEFMDKKTLLLEWKPEEAQIETHSVEVDIKVPGVIVEKDINNKDTEGKKIDIVTVLFLIVIAFLSTLYHNCQHLFQ